MDSGQYAVDIDGRRLLEKLNIECLDRQIRLMVFKF